MGSGHDPIAIVGAGFRLPGDIADEAALWDALMGRYARPILGQPPAGRWPRGIPELDELLKHDNNFHGGWLSDACMRWEPERFAITAREAPHVRPNTRLVLECAHDALEDAGLTTAQMEGSSTGVIVGAKPEDHWDKLTTAASPGASQYDRFYISGAAHSTTSARVAHWLGTTGPISTVDSACASGSMALHQARLLIEAGDCEMAIVAGVTTHLWPGPLLALSDAQMRSPRSQGGCLVLSSEADGYVPSEACVAFILAKRSTADRLGLRTRLELLSSRVGHNGRNTNGIVAPSCRAQEQLLSSILEGRSLSDVTLLELHGTGTRVGDATEVNTIVKHLGGQDATDLRLGSSKAVFGHTEEASGLVGILKVMVALEKGIVPPFAVPQQLSDKLDPASVKPLLNRQAEELEESEEGHLALVNSFGAFGAITSVLVRRPSTSASTSLLTPALQVPFVLSATSVEGLDSMRAALKRQCQGLGPADAADLAHTLAVRRTHHNFRAALLHGGQEISAPSKTSSSIAFIFSGQGFSYLDPLRRLVDSHDDASRYFTMLRQNLVLLHAPHNPDMYSIEGDATWDSLNEVEAQLLTVLFHLCLGKCMVDWGIAPQHVIGHSLGSVAAAHFAGHLSVKDTLRLAIARSEAIAQTESGRMLAIKADKAAVEDLLLSTGSESSISNYNGPLSHVVSGPDVGRVEAAAKSTGLTCRFLNTPHSYHSSGMASAADQLLQSLAAHSWPADPAPAAATMVSDMTGRAESAYTYRNPQYWADHLVSPVLFEDAVRAVRAIERDTLFVEIGPSDGMTKLVHQQGKSTHCISSFSHEGKPALDALLAHLFCAGVDIDWKALWDRDSAPMQAVAAPPTPFKRTKMWPKGPARKEGEAAMVTTKSTPQMLDILSQHRIHGQIVVPIALMIGMITSSALDLAQGIDAIELEGVEFLRPARLSDAQAKEAAFVTTFESWPDSGSTFTLSLQRNAATRLDLCRGTIASCSAPSSGLPTEVAQSATGLYDNAALKATGLDYGEAFRLVDSLHNGVGRVDFLTRSSIAQPLNATSPDPCQLDASLHSVLLAQSDGQSLGLPYKIRQMQISTSGAHWSGGVRGRVAELRDWDIASRQGVPLMSIRGLQFSGGEKKTQEPNNSAMTFASIPEWHAVSTQTLSTASILSPGEKVVVATDDVHKGQALAQVLGAAVTVAPTQDAHRALEELRHATEQSKELTLIYWTSSMQDATLSLDTAAMTVMLPLQMLQTLVATSIKWQALVCYSPPAGPPTSSLLAGLIPAFTAEHRQSREKVASVEIPAESEPQVVAESLAQTLRLRKTGIVTAHSAFRADQQGRLQRFTLRHTPVPTQQQSLQEPTGGAWVITGGTGDVCMALLPWLARTLLPKHLLLIGRRPASDVQERISKLQSSTSTTIAYEQLRDPASAAELAQIIQRCQSSTPITGILHAAGALYPSLFKQVKEEDLRDSLVSKAALAWNLHQVCPPTVKHFWLLSSFAAVVGMPALASYAIANQFVDALARSRRAQSLPALSIQLGGWAGSSMSDRVHDIMRTPHPDMAPEEACRLLENVLKMGRECPPVVSIATMNVDTDAGRLFAQDPAFHPLIEYLQARRIIPAPAKEEPPPAQPLVEQPARNPSATVAPKSIAPPAPIEVEPVTSHTPPAQDTPASQPSEDADVATQLRNLIAHILRIESPSSIKSDQPLGELGWDSLYHTEFRGLVKARMGKIVPDDLAQHEITLQRVAEAVA